MGDNVLRLQADWVFPVTGPPVENGVVEVHGDRIVALHQRPATGVRQFAGWAIIPGLVNAHTHLEFSGLQEPLQPAVPFCDWLRRLMEWRRQAPPETAITVAVGQREALRLGTTTLGEILSRSGNPEYLTAAPHTLVFQESLGLAPARHTAEADRARLFLEEAAKRPHLQGGLSPHAPYSVHPDLVRDLGLLAAEFQVPVAMHLAETRAELELLAYGRGEFVRFLEELGVWDATAIPRGMRILDYLKLLENAPRVLVVHGNYLGVEEQEWLAPRMQFSVVYCPRTHAYFQHDTHPFQQLQRSGIRVALGTDSRASNPDLDLWSEVQFLYRSCSGMSPATLLRMATLDGAEALGLGEETGSLGVGKRADLLLVPLGSAHNDTDPYVRLFQSADSRRIVMHAGQWLPASLPDCQRSAL